MNKLKTILASKFESFYYFYKKVGFKLSFFLFLNFVTVLADSLGLSLFFSLFKYTNLDNETSDTDNLSRFMHWFFDVVHLQISFTSIIGLIIVFFIVKGLFNYLSFLFQINLKLQFVKDTRERLVSGFNSLNFIHFTNTNVGKIQNILINDLNVLSDAFKFYFESFNNFIIVIAYLMVAFFINWEFTLLIGIVGILFHYLFKILQNKTKGFSKIYTSLSDQNAGLINQNLTSYKYLRATNRIKEFQRKIVDKIEEIYFTHKKIGKMESLLMASREPLLVVLICSVILVQVKFLNVSIASVMVVLLLFYRAMGNLMVMQSSYNVYLSKYGSIENVQNFEKEIETNKEQFQGTTKIATFENLKFENAGLQIGEKSILKNIQFSLNKYQSVAFVGESGSGKTTLVNVICGLYHLTQGKYTINNQDIETLSIQEVRNKIGYISQEPVIFEGTIFENITFWSEKNIKNLEKFQKVIKQTSLSQFIDELPNGLDTKIGQFGLSISGGQRQRISIARELFRDVELLILDEATSALDSETENELKDSLIRLKGTITMITIAHRLSTIKNVDTIFIVKKGEIIEYGTFDELKSNSIYFKSLTNLQGI
ncbi:ABC transporter ATP-binding protein [Flavobacterium sp. UBA7663]|uniref:ABC transporter ATP-binding protein n=1 Tax=Flavobacterium sp. UBA7663 TaxID=1946557 RepID=UPI0025C54BE2|nr:ABC transporter ATP-binding protein [Flavobacterium sp. UBA7663]